MTNKILTRPACLEMAHHGCQSKGRRTGAAGDGISHSLEKFDRQHVLLTPMSINLKCETGSLEVGPTCMLPSPVHPVDSCVSALSPSFQDFAHRILNQLSLQFNGQESKQEEGLLPFSKILATHPTRGPADIGKCDLGY